MNLLDTHIWVRWLTGEADPLPTTIVQQVDAAQTLAVSVISWWEVAMLAKTWSADFVPAPGRLVL